jgi:hypothetical protein
MSMSLINYHLKVNEKQPLLPRHPKGTGAGEFMRCFQVNLFSGPPAWGQQANHPLRKLTYFLTQEISVDIQKSL